MFLQLLLLLLLLLLSMALSPENFGLSPPYAVMAGICLHCLSSLSCLSADAFVLDGPNFRTAPRSEDYDLRTSSQIDAALNRVHNTNDPIITSDKISIKSCLFKWVYRSDHAID